MTFHLKLRFAVILSQQFLINKTKKPSIYFATFLLLNNGNCNTEPQETALMEKTSIAIVIRLQILLQLLNPRMATFLEDLQRKHGILLINTT